VQAAGVIGVRGKRLLATDLGIEILPGPHMAKAGFMEFCGRRRSSGGGPAFATAHLRFSKWPEREAVGDSASAGKFWVGCTPVAASQNQRGRMGGLAVIRHDLKRFLSDQHGIRAGHSHRLAGLNHSRGLGIVRAIAAISATTTIFRWVARSAEWMEWFM
jgi:hypothetical protein